MKITKPISKMSSSHLRRLYKSLWAEKERIDWENKKILGGCTSWPRDGHGPITPEKSELPINLLEAIDRELFERWQDYH